MVSTVVIGGGVAGLVAARELARGGAQVTLLEGGTLGGSVARRILDGLVLDVGAEGFATRGDAVAGLLADLGLDHHVASPEPTGTWIYRGGQVTRIPDGAVLGIPTRLDDAALDQLGAQAAARLRSDATLAAAGADAATLGALVRTRMGDAVVDTWLKPLVAGVHRLDVDAIPPELLLPGVLDRLRERGSLAAALGGGDGGGLAGLSGGIAQLVDALVGEVTTLGALLLPLGAEAVERDGTGWRVRTSDSSVVHGDRLLLACPPWWWPAGLPAAVAAAGRDWPQPRPVDVLTVVLASDGGGRRAGVVVADGGGAVRARALTYSSAKWGWLAEQAGERAVLRMTYDAVDVGDEALAATALADAAALTGASWTSRDLLAADRTRWLMPHTAVEPGMAGHQDDVRSAVADADGLDATGGWLAGTGLAWTIADALAVGRSAQA